MSVDVTAMCVECTGRYVEWLDCDRHIVDCYRLACYGCGHDNYDCEDKYA